MQVTDPAGKWKTTVTDVQGKAQTESNLLFEQVVLVIPATPAGGFRQSITVAHAVNRAEYERRLQ